MTSYSDLYGSYSITADTLQVQNAILVNITLETLNALDNKNITSNNNIVISPPNKLIGNVSGNLTGTVLGDVIGNLTGNGIGNWVGNVQGNVTGSASSITGEFNGDIIGTQNTTQIASGVIVNDDISLNAAITDNKLATITTTGKVANSATTATHFAIGNTLISRNADGDFNSVSCGLKYLSLGLNGLGYGSLGINGGNSIGSIYPAFDTYGDGIHFGYNFTNYHTKADAPSVVTNGGTSRISCGYSYILLACGGGNQAPIDRLSINSNGDI